MPHVRVTPKSAAASERPGHWAGRASGWPGQRAERARLLASRASSCEMRGRVPTYSAIRRASRDALRPAARPAPRQRRMKSGPVRAGPGAPGAPACGTKFTMSANSAELSGRTFLVTGANTGIGLATATGLAKRNGKVFVACRSAQKGRAAAAGISAGTGNDGVAFLPLDLSDLASVRACAREFL